MLVYFSAIVCTVMVVVMVQIMYGYSKLDPLSGIEPHSGAEGPLVSVIVPACNESESIENALRLLCRSDYSNVEIIVVDDRSTDNTAAIIESVRADFPSIRLIRVDHLPDGWLGKPHALQQGAREAAGEYILFVDADVCLEQSVISRAVRAMEERALDHLSMIFQNSSPGLLLNALIADTGAGLFFLTKPWKAKQADSRYFMGVGAFNMVRTSTYRAIGEHRNIKLQVIDDVFLGKLIKEGGYHQECMLGESLVSLPWYHSLPQMIDGLMKNVYAFFHYRPGFVVLGIAAIIAVVVAPMAGAIFARGTAQLIFILAVLVRIGGVGGGMIRIGLSPASILLLLVTPFISLFIICRAVVQVHRAGGVDWRGSFYGLEMLKKAEWVLSGLFWPVTRKK